MATVKDLDQAGTLFFLSFLSLGAAIVAFLKGAFWGNFHLGYIFLILTLIFFFWGFEKSQ